MGSVPKHAAESASQSERSNWSKDFVEHLRTVHFTLIVASLILIVAATNTEYVRFNRALTQAEQIEQFQGRWSSFPERLYTTFLKDHSLNEHVYLDVKVSPSTVYFVELSPSEVLKLEPWTIQVGDHSKHVDFVNLLQDQQVTLNDFIRLWNAFVVGRDLYAIESPNPRDCIFGFSIKDKKGDAMKGPERRCQILDINDDTMNSKAQDVLLGPDPCRLTDTVPYELGKEPNLQLGSPLIGCGFELKTPRPEITHPYVRVKLDRLAIRVDERLLVKASGFQWHKGSFSEAFPELTSVSGELTNLPTTEVVRRLSSQGTNERSISMFGFSLPIVQLSQWGIVILFALQFYFWLHLHELSSRLKPDDDGWRVAWLGIYKKWAALFAMFISSSILPVAAAIALMRRYGETPSFDTGIMSALKVGVVVCAVMGALTMWRIIRLRRSIPYSESPMTDEL